MALPVHDDGRPRALVRAGGVVGPPRYWAAKGAQLGATLALTSTALVASVVAYLGPTLAVAALVAVVGLATAAAATAVGATAGALTPGLLERSRGRVPLAVLVPSCAAVGAAGGALTGATAWAAARAMLPMFGAQEAAQMTWFGAELGLVAALFWWLPFTVATVMGRRWPVTTAIGVGAPLTMFALALLGAL